MNDFNLSDEWIREHGGFVRSLSRSILREEYRDDAVQEAWLAALQAPPERSPAAWLRAVTGRLAGRIQREGKRRVHREQAVARPEALPSTASVVERAEIVRLVGEVVAGLREPYREALILRYYEELPPRAIATRLGVPVATVMSRIQRGLRLARAELAEQSRGHRRPWTETLAVAVGFDPRRLAPTSGTLLTLGALTMKAKTGLVLGALALLAASTLGIREWRRPTEAPATIAAAPAPTSRAMASTPPVAPPAVLEETEDERLAVTPAEPPPAVSNARRLQGSVLDPAGRGVGQAEVLAGPDAFDLRVVATADERGDFVLAVAPGDRFVCARAAGWGPSALVEVTEVLGDTPALELVLPVLGVSLEVSVVDSGGAGVPAAVVFAGREVQRDFRHADGRIARTAPGFREVTDGIGIARFEGLASGWIRVTVTHPEFAPSTVFATLHPGQWNGVDVRLDEGLHVEGVVLDEEGRPVVGARLTRGSSRARTATSDANGAFRFGPIDAGKVVVSGPHGRRAETRIDGRPGQTVSWSPVLRADATLCGVVLDPVGRPRAGARVTANLDTWPGWSRGTETDARGSFEIHGCPEGSLRVEVYEDAQAVFPRLVLEGAEAGPEELQIVLEDVELVAVHGKVVAPAGVDPELHLRHVTTPLRQRITGGTGQRLDLVEGAFHVDDVPDGRYQIVATGTPYGHATVAAFRVQGTEVDLGLLELPRPGTLATTFIRQAGLPSAVATFLLENREQFATILDIDGEFPDLLDLAPGDYVLQVEVTPGPQTEYAFQIESGETTALRVDLGSTCTHRILVRLRSGSRPDGTVAVTVRQLDEERIVADGVVTRVEDGAWVHEVELGPGRFEFIARTPAGREARAVHNLFTSTPGREIELVIER